MSVLRVQRIAAGLAFAATCGVAVNARAAEPERLRVLTWNAWGLPAVSTNLRARMAALPAAIAKLNPDVVLLQEIWAESDGMTIKRGLERHGYRYSNHLAHTKYGMTGLFTASKLPLKNVSFLPFASGRVGHSFWHLEWLASKGIGTYIVQTPLGEVEVQNTHLQAQYDTDSYAAERLSQASEILSMHRDWSLPLVLGGDFNSGAEELPRRALLDLDELRDASPSPLPDTIYVRDGSRMSVRIVETRQALTEPVQLDNGVTTVLSDHPAVVVDLELSACSDCARAAVGNVVMRATARSALVSAAAITPGRVSWALGTAACLLGLAVSLVRRTRELHRRSLRFRWLRRAALAVLATGVVWTAYLGVFYYPARASALRLVAGELSPP
ncbi:MAG TPA: endonuclease/exonuclease/phosphatase family protein [Polyangiaceae bacterium]|nr:endonuclease/exonuclease/phosphatase family protein [Polyangiaceae bacterium]